MLLWGLIEDDLYFSKVAKKENEEQKEHKCACGRTVCCGKHKVCRTKKEQQIRFVKEREL